MRTAHLGEKRTTMNTATNAITGGDFLPDFFTTGFLVILALGLFVGRRARSALAATRVIIGLGIAWIPIGLILMFFIGGFGMAADSYENRTARNEGRGIELYDGSTAPVDAKEEEVRRQLAEIQRQQEEEPDHHDEMVAILDQITNG